MRGLPDRALRLRLRRFDDIFAATQFTKALDDLRKFKNQKKNEEKIANEQASPRTRTRAPTVIASVT